MKNLNRFITCIVLLIFASSCSKDDAPAADPNAVITKPILDLNYSNGNLSTGSKASEGTDAPAGYTWSEIEPSNISLAFNGSGVFFLADDFTIPVGEKWTISKFIFFAYQTNYGGAESPFNDVKYEIYSSNPSVATATKIYGDFTTNKYNTSEDAKIYRISNSLTTATSTNRKVYKITANATNLELLSGTYWIKWQTKTITDAPNYNAPNTTKGFATLPGYNAILSNNGDWTEASNGVGNKVDFPFRIVGTKTVL